MDYSLTWDEALSVALAAIGLYLSLLLALRLTGRRLVAPLTTYDVAAGIALGAVFGRAVLGYTPTLPAGVIGIATLALLHLATRLACRLSRLGPLLGEGPMLLVSDGQLQAHALRRARLSEADLRVALRRASLGSFSQVGAMVLERSGAISVLRSGQPLDDALVDVGGARKSRAIA